MELSHYSKSPVLEVFSVTQEKEASMKPRGFWVSVDGPDDWKEWCEANDFHFDRLQIKQRIVLSADANLLKITSAKELRAFDKKYKAASHPALRNWNIDWDVVAKEYQGIIIAPYIWELRLSDINWYYGWDCASGCIWDTKAIVNVSTLCST